MDADGNNRKYVSNIESRSKRLLHLSPMEKPRSDDLPMLNMRSSRQDVLPTSPRLPGRIIDDLMYKHWDEWVTGIPHPFLGDF